MNSFDKHTVIDGTHAAEICLECARVALLEKVASEATHAVLAWIQPSVYSEELRIPKFVVPLKDAVLALHPESPQSDKLSDIFGKSDK